MSGVAPRAPRKGTKNNKDGEQQQVPASRITALALVPNEQNIVFAGFETGLIHRLRRGAPADEAPLVVLSGHTAPVTGLSAPTSGDDVTSCSLDGTIKIWSSVLFNPAADPGAPPPKRCLRTVNVGQPIRSMYAGPSGDVFYCGTARGTVVRVEGNKVVDELVGGHTESVTAVAMAESGALLTGSLDGTVVGWDLSSRAPVFVFKGHNGHVRAATVSGSNLYTCGSDESLCCFAVPMDFTPPVDATAAAAMDSTGAYDSGAVAGDDVDPDDVADDGAADDGSAPPPKDAGAAAADEANDNNNNNNNADAPVDISWVIKPSAKVQLPWLPTSIAIVGNFAIIGTSGRIVASVNIRALNSKVAEYATRVDKSISDAERKVRKLAHEKKRKAQRAARKAVRVFKNEHGGGAVGEDNEYADNEEPQYDEEGNEISVGGGGGDGEDHSAEIEEFERQQMQDAQDRAAEVDSDTAAQIARFARLRSQYFTQSATNFITSAMCDIVPGTCRDSVFCVVGEGAKVYAASGTGVEALTLRPRVRAV